MAELPHERLFGDFGDWPGRDVLDSGGDRLGGVREIYLDRETGRPEWVLIEVEDDQPRFAPLVDASVEEQAIRVAHAGDVVRAAPAVGPDAQIGNDEERRLYAHYGIGYSEEASDSGLPADVTIADAAPTAVMARDEGAPASEGEAAPAEPPTADDAAPGDAAAAVAMAPGEGAPGPDEGSLWSEADAPAPPAPTDAAPGEQTPGLPQSGPPEPPAFAPVEPATPGMPQPPQPEAGPAAPPPPVGERPAPPPPPPPPESEGSARRLELAGGAAILAVLLFLLMRRLRS